MLRLIFYKPIYFGRFDFELVVEKLGQLSGSTFLRFLKVSGTRGARPNRGAENWNFLCIRILSFLRGGGGGGSP